MKIGVDVRHLQMKPDTGGARVMRNALLASAEFDPVHQFVPYHDAIGQWGLRHPLAAAFCADVLSKNVWIPLWARARNIEILLHFLPPCSWIECQLPQIAYILDVPEKQENASWQDWIYNEIFIHGTAKKADHILTISLFSADQITHRLRVPASRISIIHPCIDHRMFHTGATVPALKLQLAEAGVSRYVFGVVSSLTPRKNPGAFISIFAKIASALRHEFKLVIAGAPSSLNDFRPFASDRDIDETAADIRILGRVTDNELAALYAGAEAVIFPSRYEGFGLPVIEASYCGAPVICSDLPVLKEVAPPDTLFFAPDDSTGMANAVEHILSSPHQIDTGEPNWLEWAKRYCYQTHARHLANVIDSVIKH